MTDAIDALTLCGWATHHILRDTWAEAVGLQLQVHFTEGEITFKFDYFPGQAPSEKYGVKGEEPGWCVIDVEYRGGVHLSRPDHPIRDVVGGF